jgi:predicted GIY-YIG superfamily endonuclease
MVSSVARQFTVSEGGQKAQELQEVMFYTYVLRSIPDPSRRYIGHTSDLRARLAEHNAGKAPHTSKFRPWKVETYIAFEAIEKAQAFERYLKSGSGHEFARRHF